MFTNFLSNAVVFDKVDPLQVSEFVNSHLGNHKLKFSHQKHDLKCTSRLSFSDFASLGISYISYGNEVHVDCPELEGAYHFQVVTKGKCYWRFLDEDLDLHSGQALMMNPGEQINLTYSEDCEKIIIKVPEELVRDAYLNTSGFLPSAGVRFERKKIELNHSIGFMRLLDSLLLEANEDVSEVSNLNLHLRYRDTLVYKILQQFDSNIVSECSTPINDRRLSNLLSYIEKNIHGELTVEELSQVGNMSIRTVYNMFYKYLDTTPRQFIKLSKLQSLHTEMVNCKGERSVTEVALDYGFTHLGRFSSDYRKVFNELPSETLRRRV